MDCSSPASLARLMVVFTFPPNSKASVVLLKTPAFPFLPAMSITQRASSAEIPAQTFSLSRYRHQARYSTHRQGGRVRRLLLNKPNAPPDTVNSLKLHVYPVNNTSGTSTGFCCALSVLFSALHLVLLLLFVSLSFGYNSLN